jgi:hypothetical protein
MFSKILVLVPTETWQLVEANGASKVQIRDPTAISPTSFHIRRKTQHFAPYKKHNTLLHTAATYKPYKFRQIPPLRFIHSFTSLLLRSTTGAPQQPFLVSVTPLHKALALALHLFGQDRSVVLQGTRL